jgi:hypothetical protein
MTDPAVAVNATPLDAVLDLDALPGDAVATGPEVLPKEAIKKELKHAPLLMLTIHDFKTVAARYFGQVYRGSDVRAFSSPDQLYGMLAEYSQIDRLVILAHAFNDQILLGSVQLTIGQLQANLDKISMPRIGTLNFDGCTVGKAASQLYEFAKNFAIPTVEAFTYFHHIEIWKRYRTNVNFPVQPEIDYEAPYLPIDTSGAHVEAAVLKAEFAQGGYTQVSEFFTYLYEESLTFEALLPTAGWDLNLPPSLEPLRQVRRVEDGRYPRSALTSVELTSSEAAANFTTQVNPPPPKDSNGKLIESDNTPYRVIVKPAPSPP